MKRAAGVSAELGHLRPNSSSVGASRRPIRINVGCGPSPTPGWENYDNSWSVRLANHPRIAWFLRRASVLAPSQVYFIHTARQEGIKFWTAMRLHYEDGAVDVLYSSHMLEHLDRDSARQFVHEAYRVLKPGGAIRIVVPDLALLVDRYNESCDADEFVAASLLASDRPRTFLGRLRYLVLGGRHHAWMYDERSLVALLKAAGFREVHRMKPGETSIADVGALDLFERASESLYVEAFTANHGHVAVNATGGPA